MPITVTTDLPDAATVQRSNTVKDQLTVSWDDTINYGDYRPEWKESGETDWNAALSNRTVINSADSLTNWSTQDSAYISLSTTTAYSEDGTAVRADVTDGSAGNTTRDFHYTLPSAIDLSTADYIQFWFYCETPTGDATNIDFAIGDSSGTYDWAIGFESQVDDGIATTVQIDLSTVEGTVDLSSVDEFYWRLRSLGTGDWAAVDSIIYGSDVVGQATTSVTIPHLEDGEEYNARVRTETEHKTGAWKPSTSGLTTLTQLPAPTGVTVDASTDRQAVVTWTRNDDNTEGTFEIFRSTTGSTLGTSVGTVSPTTQTFTDTGLDDGTTYYYTVRRNTAHRFSDSSDANADGSQVSATTNLPAPTGVSATVDANDQITVSWTDNSNSETQFYVQMKRDGAASWVDPASGPTTGASATNLVVRSKSDSDYGAQVGIDSSFTFRVRAETSDTNSSWNSSGTVYTDPAPPHNPSVSRPDGNTVELSAAVQSDIPDRISVHYKEDTGSGYGSWTWFDTIESGEETSGSVDITGSTWTRRYTVGTTYQAGHSLQQDARYQFRFLTHDPSGRTSEWVYADFGNDGNVYFTDGFESGGLTNWTTTTTADSESGVRSTTNTTTSDNLGISGADDGSHWLELAGTDSVTKDLGDLSSESNVFVKCAIAAGSVDSDGDGPLVEWYDGTTWQTLHEHNWEYNKQGWVELNLPVPSSYLSTGNKLRFNNDTGTVDFLAVDRVVVSDILHEYTTPAAPTALSLDTSTEDEITATWTNNDAFAALTDGEGHDIEWRTTGASSWNNTPNTAGNIRVLTGLADGEEYEVRARTFVRQSRRGTNPNTWIVTSTVQTAITLIPAPTNVSISNVGYTSFDVGWTDNSDNEDSFEIRLSTDGSTYTTHGSVTADTTTYTVTGLTGGEKYWVQVRAVTEDATNDSSAVTQTTDLHKPTVSTAYDADYNIELTIGNLGDTTAGTMSIYRSKTEGQKGTAIATDIAPNTLYEDSTVTAGVPYYYTVQRNGSDATVESDQVSGELPDSWMVDGTALGTISDETLDWESLEFSTVTNKDKLAAVLNDVQANAEKMHRVVDADGKPETFDTSSTGAANTYTFTPPQPQSNFYEETEWLIAGYSREVHDSRGQRYNSDIEAVRKTNYTESQASGSDVTWFKYLDRCDAISNFTGIDLTLTTVADPSDDGTAIKGTQNSANPASDENDFAWLPGATHSLSGTFYVAIYPAYSEASQMTIQFRDSNANTYENDIEALSGQTLTPNKWNYVSIDTTQITGNSTVDITVIDRILIRCRGMAQNEYTVLDSMGTYGYGSPTGESAPKATVLDREFHFDFFSGDFTTQKVQAAVESGTEDAVDTKQITLNLSADQANIVRGSCSHQGAVNVRTVPDGVNLAEDNSPNNRNTVTVTSPGKYGEDVLGSGTYVVSSWEIKNLNDVTYLVELDLLHAL